jgi:hypothetical protein
MGLLAGSLVVFWFSFTALAGDAGAPVNVPADDDWHLTTSAGIWGMSATGTAGIRGADVDVDASFSDIVDKTDLALNPGVELNKGPWVIDFNGMYARLSNDTDFPNGISVEAKATQIVGTLALGYTILDTKLDNGMPLKITPAIGIRYNYLEVKLDPSFAPTVKKNKQWVDPIVGGQIILGLTDNLAWRTEGTIGGGGDVLNGCVLTWSAGTFLDWQFARSWALNVGYRALSWDYEQDPVKFDVTYHGPWIGISHQWF